MELDLRHARRPLTAVDPDTGTTTSTYDADGELQSSTDQTGTTLRYSYDADGRRTAVDQDSATGPLLASWQYDTLPNGKGLLSSDTSYVGSTAGTGGAPGTPGSTPYTKAITRYDVDGRPLGSTVTLPADTFGAGAPAYSYTTTVTYDPDGSVATQVDPAAGGLPAETLHYTYTSLGRLYSLIGRNQYLEAAAYDQIGDVGSVPANHTHAYDDAGAIVSDTNTPSTGPSRYPVLPVGIAPVGETNGPGCRRPTNAICEFAG